MRQSAAFFRKPAEPAAFEVRRGLVQHVERRHVGDGAVPAAGEENTIRVGSELERVLYLGPALVAPGPHRRPVSVLADEVGSPGEEHRVELQSLRSELGDHVAKVPARERAFDSLAVPGSVAQVPGRGVVIRYAEPDQVLVARGCEDAESGERAFPLAVLQVFPRYGVIAGETQVVALRFETPRELSAGVRIPGE